MTAPTLPERERAVRPVCCTRWAVVGPDGSLRFLASAAGEAGRTLATSMAFEHLHERVAVVEIREVVQP